MLLPVPGLRVTRGCPTEKHGTPGARRHLHRFACMYSRMGRQSWDRVGDKGASAVALDDPVWQTGANHLATEISHRCTEFSVWSRCHTALDARGKLQFNCNERKEQI